MTAQSMLIYFLAAVFEIAGCFSFWAWLRNGRPGWIVVPGLISLVGFACALTQVSAFHAGRAYAAYGGVYVVTSLLWLYAVEGVRPDRWDLLGSLICVVGALVILGGPRSH